MDKLRALRVFARVAQEGSLVAAAQALDLTPTAVTRTLADLEDSLGTRLLHRNTRRLALTEAGEDDLMYALQALQLLDDAQALIDSRLTEAAGRLRVTVGSAFASHQLMRHMVAFHARYPKVGLEFHVPASVTTVDENSDVSILIVDADLPDRGCVARRLAASEIVPCASARYLARRGHPQHPQELQQHDIVTPHAMRGELRFTHRAGAGGADAPSVTVAMPRPLLDTNDYELNLAAALSDLGIAGLPSFVAADALRRGELEVVLPQWRLFALGVHAAMPSRRHLPLRTRAFVDFCVECFGGDDRDPWLAAPARADGAAAWQPAPQRPG